MASFATSFASISNMSDSSSFTNNVNVHLPIDKLDGKNYATWVVDVKLWLESQAYVDHLTLKVINNALGDFPH